MTYELGIIGGPHVETASPTPMMGNALLKHLGIDGAYKAYPFKDSSDVPTFLDGKRGDYNWRGYFVTMPHKKTVKDYIGRHFRLLDKHAERSDAVNVVVRTAGKLWGYNTDGLGFVDSLKAARPRIKIEGRQVVMLGAGGGARSIAHALADEGIESLHIYNRTPEHASYLASLLKDNVDDVQFGSLRDAEAVLPETDILIHTTPTGMGGSNESLLSTAQLSLTPRRCVVADIVAFPPETKLILDARKQKRRTVTGDGMITRQHIRGVRYIFPEADVGRLGAEAVRVVQGAYKEFVREKLGWYD